MVPIFDEVRMQISLLWYRSDIPGIRNNWIHHPLLQLYTGCNREHLPGEWERHHQQWNRWTNPRTFLPCIGIGRFQSSFHSKYRRVRRVMQYPPLRHFHSLKAIMRTDSYLDMCRFYGFHLRWELEIDTGHSIPNVAFTVPDSSVPSKMFLLWI